MPDGQRARRIGIGTVITGKRRHRDRVGAGAGPVSAGGHVVGGRGRRPEQDQAVRAVAAVVVVGVGDSPARPAVLRDRIDTVQIRIRERPLVIEAALSPDLVQRAGIECGGEPVHIARQFNLARGGPADAHGAGSAGIGRILIGAIYRLHRQRVMTSLAYIVRDAAHLERVGVVDARLDIETVEAVMCHPGEHGPRVHHARRTACC